jgi:cyclic pyranopterin phosphate synthase
MTDGAETGRGLTHVSSSGEARMVDVSDKAETQRRARATGSIRMQTATLAAIVGAQIKKGDVLGVARIAGVMAAKRTADLIPLCHSLALSDVQVLLEPDESLPGVRAEAIVRTTGRTGVEMEALTAVSVALLTVYDMAKAMDRGMVISDISLAEKSGGAHGDFSRVDDGGVSPYRGSGSTR